jgi:hypothetical protein
MDCREATAAMADLLDGTASAAVRDAVGEHADGCADCRLRLAAYRAVDRLAASPLGTGGATEPSRAKERLFALLDAEGALPPPAEGKVVPLAPRRRLPLGVVGAVAAALAAVVLWRAVPRSPAPAPPSPPLAERPSASRVAAAPKPLPPSSRGGSASVPALSGEDAEMVALLDLLDSPGVPDAGEKDMEDFLSGSEDHRG